MAEAVGVLAKIGASLAWVVADGPPLATSALVRGSAHQFPVANVGTPFDNTFAVPIRRSALELPTVAGIRTGARQTISEAVCFPTDIEAQTKIAAGRAADVAV